MKNINDWKTFNELKLSTYKNASKLAKKYGRDNLSSDLLSHGKKQDEDKRKDDALSHIDKDLKPFMFADPAIGELNFLGFDNGMSYDEWVESEGILQLQLSFIDSTGDKSYFMFITSDLNNLESKEGPLTLIENEEGDVVNDQLSNRGDARRLKKLVADNYDVLIKDFEGYDYIANMDRLKEEYEKIINLPVHYFYR